MTGRDDKAARNRPEPRSGPWGENVAANRDVPEAIRPAPPSALAAVDPGEPAELAGDEPATGASNPATRPGVPAPRPAMRTSPVIQPAPPAQSSPPAQSTPPAPQAGEPAGLKDASAGDANADAEPTPPAAHPDTVIRPVTMADEASSAGHAATASGPVADGDEAGSPAGEPGVPGAGVAHEAHEAPTLTALPGAAAAAAGASGPRGATEVSEHAGAQTAGLAGRAELGREGLDRAGANQAGSGPAELDRAEAGAGAAQPPAPWLQPVGPDPSWPTVLRNTVRLWFERRRKQSGPQVPRRRSKWRTLALILLVIVVFAAGAFTVRLIGKDTKAPAGHTSPPAGGGAAAAAQARNDTAAWVSTEVSHGAIVACDQVMCAVLEQHGFPAGSLLPLDAASNDPLGSAVVIATAAVQNYFGHRLKDEYAPVAIAAFGSGTARIQVLVIASDGALAYGKALQADQRARRLTGQELLSNPQITTSPAARADITSGQVDSRLLISLAPLASQVHQVRIASFSPAAPGAAPGVPLRSVDLAVPSGTGASSYLAAAQSFLRAQRAPYLASTIKITRLADGSTVLRVGFSAPSPLGLLGTPISGKQPG
jgi:hypothetical protein